MEKLGQILHKNLYMYDLALQLSYGKYNKSMINFIEEISKIDSILEYDIFRSYMKQIPKLAHGDIYSIQRSFAENTLYGHAYNLLKYAGMQEKEIFYAPVLEHGIPYSSKFDSNKYKLNNAYIFQGKNNSESWVKEKKQKAYYIGPYIHYCTGIYDSETIQNMKKKNGLTALLFLPHSIETNAFKVNVHNIIEEFRAIEGLEIKTVLACVYCMDALNIDDIKEKSIKFVSAGFKLDNNFIRRLKSILELADVVYYSSFSSSIGYAYYLNKKIICNPTLEDLKKLEHLIDKSAMEKMIKLRDLFGVNSEENKQLQYDFINQYWGLDQIKTPNEVKKIISDNKFRIIRHLGF